MDGPTTLTRKSNFWNLKMKLKLPNEPIWSDLGKSTFRFSGFFKFRVLNFYHGNFKDPDITYLQPRPRRQPAGVQWDLWGPKINGFHWEKLHPYYNGNISPSKKNSYLEAHFVVIVTIALVVNFQKTPQLVVYSGDENQPIWKMENLQRSKYRKGCFQGPFSHANFKYGPNTLWRGGFFLPFGVIIVKSKFLAW